MSSQRDKASGKSGANRGFGPRRGGGPMAMMKGEKARDFKGTIARLVRYMDVYKGKITIVFFFAVASTLFTILGPRFLGMATTEIFKGVMERISGNGSVDMSAVGRIILIVLSIYVLSSLFAYAMGWIMSRVSTDITYRFRKEISHKINRIPMKFYDKTTHGEILSRITNDVDIISQTLSQSLTQIITSAVSIVGVLVMMFLISWQMTLVALLILPLSLLLVRFIVKRSQKHFKTQQEYLGHINGHVEEMFSGHWVMRAFNGEEKSIQRFSESNEKLYHSAWRAQFLSGLMMPMMTFITNLGYVGITLLGGWMALKKLITIGDIQAFIQYIRNFTQPIMQIANISNILQQTAAAAERVFEFLDEKEEIAETENPLSPKKINGSVEFNHVRFGYDRENPVIKDFSAAALPGQKIAIVGPTGAGKTTMVKLLMRFYDVDSGSIRVNGEDIRDFTRKDLRDNFAMVLQETWLYNDSILENIRYGNPEASDDEVIAAAKAAHADHFIHTLPEGYQMLLNEETTNISQGQKQLLTIARAILADPRILILDEATSSVDTRTEVLIQKAMDNLMDNRTSFVIAHRLSTIKNADLILVMNEGDIVEQGSHEELLSKGTFYADLYNSQFEVEQAG